MKKRKKGRKFSRKKDQRKALLVSLAGSLFLKEKIKTTNARAKELSGFAEKFITKAGSGSLAARKQMASFFPQKVAKKLTEDIGPRYKNRKGGYTRIVRLGKRQTDGSDLSIISLVKEKVKSE